MDLEVFYDYHCPYSYRVVQLFEAQPEPWLRVAYRFFPLEQVNRDASATEWRLWDQPLTYEHYRGRQDRRPLAPFLATAIVETTASPSAVRAFRLAVFRAGFDERADITDVGLLVGLADEAGADSAALAAAFADESALAPARARIAEDWAHARGEYAIFGVPTLRFADGGAPFYLRLSRHVVPEEARDVLVRLHQLRRAAPYLVELKVPELSSAE